MQIDSYIIVKHELYSKLADEEINTSTYSDVGQKRGFQPRGWPTQQQSHVLEECQMIRYLVIAEV
jgi:hypothetical protein